MPLLRSVALGLSLLPLSAAPALAVMPPTSGRGPHPVACNGTLLQLQVQRQASAAVDAFSFTLGVEAEAASKAVALSQLDGRLAELRAALAPIVRGRLTVPAPSTYRSSSGSSGVRERASTTVSGVVSKTHYNRLIQTAGRLPGVSVRGFRSEAAAGSEASLRDRLLRDALDDGQRQALATADALGLRRVNLLRIDQRGDGAIRPMLNTMAAPRGFNPDEAPQPSESVSLALDYCLT
jgi:uncharacterized protein YggE